MIKSFSLLSFIILLFVAQMSHSQALNYKNILGTNYEISLPADFLFGDGYDGFQSPDGSVKILLTTTQNTNSDFFFETLMNQLTLNNSKEVFNVEKFKTNFGKAIFLENISKLENNIPDLKVLIFEDSLKTYFTI